MHSFAIACIVTAACTAIATSASADIKVRVNNTSYNISGTTGSALLQAMDRKGPKHGFLTRAIAQTRYKVGWDIDWASSRGTCRIRNVNADLTITYMYPRVTSAVSPEMKQRWNRFMKGVKRHEQTHGKIARQMVHAAERAVAGISTRNDRDCAKAKAELKRRVSRVYEKYEARQVSFDNREHHAGGNVDGLVARLIQKH